MANEWKDGLFVEIAEAEEYATPLPDDLRTLFPTAFTQTDER